MIRSAKFQNMCRTDIVDLEIVTWLVKFIIYKSVIIRKFESRFRYPFRYPFRYIENYTFKKSKIQNTDGPDWAKSKMSHRFQKNFIFSRIYFT